MLFLGAEASALEGKDVEQGIVERANAFRKAQGLEPVSTDAALEDAAERFARFMAKTGKYGHAADGRAPHERAAAQGYDYCIVSENIAYQYRSSGFESAQKLAEAFVEGWKESPGHRENLLDRAVTETGVGVARGDEGRWFAVQMFGRPAKASIHFSVANRSGEKIEYRAGGERYSLPPRATRTHKVCRPTDLAIGARNFKAEARDGARYVVSEKAVHAAQ